MKKTTLNLLAIMCFALTYTGYAQTLNQNAMWPNVNWSVTGTYNADPSAFEANPTVDANFAFDDDDAGNGSDDIIAAESPIIDLTAAHGAGETWISISADFVYNYNFDDILQFEYWDADTATWNIIGSPINADTVGAPLDNFCAGTAETYTTSILNIVAFSANQLSGFRYRIYFDDLVGAAGYEWGFCFQSPTITSETPPSCPDPVTLTASNIDGFSADLAWTETGSATLWNIELVDITTAGTPTGTPTASGVANPYNLTGLTASNDYVYYVQSDCAVDGTSAWVGPFAFSTTVACPEPSALNVTNITNSSANLGWTAGASETLWDVEIVDITTAGTATGTPTASGVANPYMATTLVDANDYEFYVRADCAVNGTSAWVGPFAFTTACNAFTAPYTQDFENAGEVPACWTLGGDEDYRFSNTGTGNHIGNNGTITGTSASGNYFAWVDDSDPNATNAQLDSPFVDLSTLTAPALSFYEISNNEEQLNATLTVSVWDGAAWNVVGTYNTNTNGWEQKIIDLSGLTFTGPAQARFSITDSGSFYDDIAIDDVSFDEAPSCFDPSTLTASNVLAFSAELGWSENGSATLWNIELVDITAAGTPTGTPTATGVANPYNLTGLAETNDYEYYVQADCGANGTSAWVGPFAFTTACSAFTAPYTQDFENTGEVPACWTLGGDEDYRFSNTGTGNHIGDNGTITGTSASGNYFAWVDDSDPNATNAQLDSPFVDLSTLTAPALSFYEISNNEEQLNATLTVSVWDGAVWNVVGTYNTNTNGWEQKIIDLSGLTFTGPAQARFSITDSGSFYDDIAIDDVSFDEAPSCFDPSTLTASNVLAYSAELGWSENGSATLWNIELVDITAAGTPTGTPTATGVTNPYNQTGLAATNDYEYYVQADCGTNGTSEWVGPFAFTTPVVCPAPSALSATNITMTAADFAWTENGASALWNIELVDVTAGGTVTGIPTATGITNPYSQTGLVGDNNYEFYVQADCGVDGTSDWTGPFSFFTPYVAVAPDCSNGMFLDSGGMSADYSSSETITYTIMPDMPGNAVSVNFTAFSSENNGATACYDGLTIHNGADASAPTMDPPGGGTVWCWDEDDTVPAGTGDLEGMTITSTDASGALTFVFTSDTSVTREGWEAIVTCATLSTADFDNSLAFTYYPNPVNDNLVIKAQKDIESISVYNMLGQELQRSTPNSINTDVNMSSLQTGAYFVKVTIGNATETIRVIKK